MSRPETGGRRVFAALVPPPELAAALVARAAEALAGADGLRPCPPEHVHLTLAFLGRVPEERLGALEGALERTARGAVPLALRVRGTGVFPEATGAAGGPGAGPARVLWADVADAAGDGALARLQRRLVRELAAEGLAPADAGRPFRAHLTLARARARARGGARGAGAAPPPAFAALALDLAWTADEILWIESRLDRTGPERYPVLARRALGGA